MLHVVLYQPEIPHNTGAIGRLCLATGATLHLIKPLGFDLSEKAVKRAGLDYWKDVSLKIWDHFDDLQEAYPENNYWYLTTKTSQSYWGARFQDGDFLVFGTESRGLPESLLQTQAQSCLTIPMQAGSTRSLNLATSAGIVMYEAFRQIEFKG